MCNHIRKNICKENNTGNRAWQLGNKYRGDKILCIAMRGEKVIGENVLDKSRLVSELRKIHIELVEVYKNIFDYKYRMDKDFKTFIDGEHKENRIKDKEKQAWNDNFCHRASYTLLNKILFVRICEDKGFMLNPEDYVLDVPKDPHIGQKLSRKGLQKWANLVTNYTLGELVRLAFLDMKKSYSNIILTKMIGTRF